MFRSILIFLLTIAFIPIHLAYPSGNVINIIFVGKHRCSNCEDFLKDQLIPTWRKLGPTDRLNITYIPYSKCSRYGDFDLSCAPDAKTLQPCIMEEMNHYGYYELQYCTQAVKTIQEAFDKCDFTGLDKDRIRECATSRSGRELLSKYQGQILDLMKKLNLNRWTYPVLIVDGIRNEAMETNLLRELCNNWLLPRPDECDIDFVHENL